MADKALADIPLDRNSNLEKWVRGWYRLLREQAYLIELGSADLKGYLSRAQGLEKFAARVKAKRVARRFERAAKLQEAAGREFAKGLATYRREYPEQISPAKKTPARGFQFRA